MNAPIQIERRRHHHFTPSELRALLRQNLGLNSRQVTVKRQSSLTYLTVTLRDPSVDIVRLDQFVRSLHTWGMDATDYVTGQSVHLEIAPEVRAALVAPILQTAEMELRGIPSIPNGRGVYWGDGKSGIVIFKRDAEFWLHCQGTNERRPYHFEYQRNESWMPAALAWDFYTLTKGIRP